MFGRVGFKYLGSVIIPFMEYTFTQLLYHEQDGTQVQLSRVQLVWFRFLFSCVEYIFSEEVFICIWIICLCLTFRFLINHIQGYVSIWCHVSPGKLFLKIKKINKKWENTLCSIIGNSVTLLNEWINKNFRTLIWSHTFRAMWSQALSCWAVTFFVESGGTFLCLKLFSKDKFDCSGN